jgi:hypothetical protein
MMATLAMASLRADRNATRVRLPLLGSESGKKERAEIKPWVRCRRRPAEVPPQPGLSLKHVSRECPRFRNKECAKSRI